MDFNKFTTKSAEAVQGAMQLAGQLSHQGVTPAHLLLVLIEQPQGLVETLLEKFKTDPRETSARVQKELEKLPRVSGEGTGSQYATPELNKIFETAEAEAKKLTDDYVSVEHFFLALLEDKDIKKFW